MPFLHKTQEDADQIMAAYAHFGAKCHAWGHHPDNVIPESATESIREFADACEYVNIFCINLPFITGDPKNPDKS